MLLHKLRFYGPSENGAILTDEFSQLCVFIVKRESKGIAKVCEIKGINKSLLKA